MGRMSVEEKCPGSRWSTNELWPEMVLGAC